MCATLQYRDIHLGCREYTMPMPRKSVTTSFRTSKALQDQIKAIAQHDRRSTNNWVRIVLEDAVKAYLEKHPEVRLSADDQRD